MNDWRGTPIARGSIIVYPGRQSSSMWMVEAEVLDIISIQQWNEEIPALLVQPLRAGFLGPTKKKPVKITAIERVTVIPVCKKSDTRTDIQASELSPEDRAIVERLIGIGD